MLVCFLYVSVNFKFDQIEKFSSECYKCALCLGEDENLYILACAQHIVLTTTSLAPQGLAYKDAWKKTFSA